MFPGQSRISISYFLLLLLLLEDFFLLDDEVDLLLPLLVEVAPLVLFPPLLEVDFVDDDDVLDELLLVLLDSDDGFTLLDVSVDLVPKLAANPARPDKPPDFVVEC